MLRPISATRMLFSFIFKDGSQNGLAIPAPWKTFVTLLDVSWEEDVPVLSLMVFVVVGKRLFLKAKDRQNLKPTNPKSQKMGYHPLLGFRQATICWIKVSGGLASRPPL